MSDLPIFTPFLGPPHAAISLQSVGLHGVKVTELTKLVSRVKSLAAKVCRAFFLLLRFFLKKRSWIFSRFQKARGVRSTATHISWPKLRLIVATFKEKTPEVGDVAEASEDATDPCHVAVKGRIRQ